MKSILPFALALFNLPLLAQPGTLLSTFGSSGKVTTDMGSNQDIVNAIAVQPDGKIVAAGQTFTLRGRLDFALARYNANGTLDTGFNGGGTLVNSITPFNDAANAVAVQPDGKILAAGGCGGGTARANPRLCLVRYNPNGSLDTTFAEGGIAFGNFPTHQPYAGRAISVQPNGKIWVGGSADGGTDLDFALARFNANGSIDSTFNGVGYVQTPLDTASVDHAVCLAVQPDGKVLVGGAEFYPNLPVGTWRFVAVRYHPNGALDSGFGDGGKFAFAFPDLANASAYAVALQPDGRIVLAGGTDVRAGFGNNDFALLRLKANGTVDSSFGQDGLVLTDFAGGSDCAKALRVGADGKIVAAGYASVLLNENVALARYTTAGALDGGFGATGEVVVDAPYCEEAQSLAFANGTLYTGGFALGGSNHDFFLTAHGTALLSPLPLRFTDFTAVKLPDGVHLEWKTAGEENTVFLDVERSADGRSFDVIGKVAALGNRPTENRYAFTDAKPEPRALYYRIKAMDRNGRETYSPTLLLRPAPTNAALQAFPNPATKVLHVRTVVEGPLQVYVNGVSGMRIKRTQQTAGNAATAFTLDVADLPPGVYTLTVKGLAETESVLFVKQ